MKESLVSRKTKQNFFELWIDNLVCRYLLKRSGHLSAMRGVPMAVFANDFIGAKIYVKGIFENERIDDLFCVISELGLKVEDAYAFDVGANIGNHSIQFSKKFKRVFAFEPNPRAFEILSSNVKRLGNVECINTGLGSKCGMLTLFENQQNFGASSTVFENDSNTTVEIKIQKLDDFAETFDTIDLIKIDVEGMEYEVLLGAEKIIDKHKPIICLEQHESEFGNDCDETRSIDLLRASGYQIYVGNFDYKLHGLVYKSLRKIYWIFFGGTLNRSVIKYYKLPKRCYDMILAIHQDKLS